MSWEGLNPPYGCVAVDPPWHYEKTNADKSAEGYAGKRGLPYSSMTLDEIKALPVGELVDDGRCFLWVTNRYLPHTQGHSVKPDAFLDLVESWCPGPYAELFCRRPRFGWDSWGYGYESERVS
jgi:N6-adenosine-specific RNA methylase IME4